MKKIICAGPGCQDRRIHYENPDTPRGPQMVEVPDDYLPERAAFCSITCALLGGYMKLEYPVKNPCPKCKLQGFEIEHHGNYKCV